MKKCVAILLIVFSAFLTVSAQTTEFTYQGSMRDGANPANGNYDIEFRMYDSLANGTQIGPTVTRSNLAVSNGQFAVTLDFGNGFPGANRYLEVRVRIAGGGGFTILDPRQKVSSSPYSVRSLSADNATNATNATTAQTAISATNATTATTATTATNALNLGGVAANQFVVTTDPRMNDTRTPTAGSVNYVQNTTNPQTASNFNISGNGTVGGTLSGNTINASTQFNIAGNRVLSAAGTNNFFAGIGAGVSNTSGSENTFIGMEAGGGHVAGSRNVFIGFRAGNAVNNMGVFEVTDNVFVGANAGRLNTQSANNNGALNTFVGSGAGELNTFGFSNSFFGYKAGNQNAFGFSNSFFGASAGIANTGSSNSFFGRRSGFSNTTGFSNTIIGSFADVASNNLSFATAIGADAVVSASNTIALGRTGGEDRVRVYGRLAVNSLAAATATHLCINTLTDEIASCSSSIRYKENVLPFTSGLITLGRLRPVTFDWKESKEHDLGLVAEEVEAVDPLLVTYNKEGQIQGVKYDRISVVLVNAVNEQQVQIEAQQKEIDNQKRVIEKQKTEIDTLRKAVCSIDPALETCRQNQ